MGERFGFWPQHNHASIAWSLWRQPRVGLQKQGLLAIVPARGWRERNFFFGFWWEGERQAGRELAMRIARPPKERGEGPKKSGWVGTGPPPGLKKKPDPIAATAGARALFPTVPSLKYHRFTA
jgi:hypothetical protein